MRLFDLTTSRVGRSRDSAAVALTFALALSGCAPSDPVEPPLPPLLRDVRAAGGWDSACPPRDQRERAMRGNSALAISPDFDARLLSAFPPGSDENTLVAALTAQGFSTHGYCPGDPSIRIADFKRKGKRFLPLDIYAQVYWKRDEDGRLQWTKGFVVYSGL